MLTRYSQNNQSLIQDGIEPNNPDELPKTFVDGKFDGVIGEECLFPEDWDYFEGWCLGHREFCCKQKGIFLPDEF